MSRRRQPRLSPKEVDEQARRRRADAADQGESLDTIELKRKRSGRQRPPPTRGLEAIVDLAHERRQALVVGALPAHVELVWSDGDVRGSPARQDVIVAKVHPALIATIGSALIVGDRVTAAILEGDQVYVVEAEPRRTLLARPAVMREKWPQPLVANAERLWIVVAQTDPAPRAGLVDRLLVASRAGDLEAGLLVTKGDLEPSPQSRVLFETYAAIGLEVLYTSVKAKTGLDDVRKALAGSFSVLVGQSGVGKSSIVGAILPRQPVAVAEVSKATGKGRHTTTVTRYYALEEGGAVVDTPGLKELGLWNTHRGHLDAAFPDVAEPAERCRFGDCHHDAEPGCEVRPNILPERLASYQKLLDEIELRNRPGFGKPGGPSVE